LLTILSGLLGITLEVASRHCFEVEFDSAPTSIGLERSRPRSGRSSTFRRVGCVQCSPTSNPACLCRAAHQPVIEAGSTIFQYESFRTTFPSWNS
jgi:hypothetical protein